MSSASLIPSASPQPVHSDRLVVGLEAIIDATAGILAAQSLQATLLAMADALLRIIPYTSLAMYEIDWDARIAIPLFATGRHVVETLASRPELERSITGSAVLAGRLVYRGPGDPVLRANVMPGTPLSEQEAIVVAPLFIGDRPQGTLNVWREDDEVRFAAEELMLLERFASLAAIAYANSTQREQLRTLALTDALTGLYNRRHCVTSLAAALTDGRRHAEPTSLAYFDVDAFKLINDAFGHTRGDETLCAFAEVLRGYTRAGDVVCRTGGEEFTVVLPRTDAEQARALTERIVAAVRASRLGPRGNLTVSADVVSSPESCDDDESLVQRVDAALLRAKRDGRDRIVVAG